MRNVKRWLALSMAALMTAGALAGCGSTADNSTADADNTTTEAADTATDSADETEAADTATSEGGYVYYLNFKPEQDEQWQELAKAYTEETGIPVKVVTAASGTYETTLTSEIGKREAPTLFSVNGPVGLQNWKDYCYDLTGTAVLGELTNDSYTLSENGEVLAMGYVIESYGIICNKTLLAQAGYSVEDIDSFEDLKAVAEDITSRSEELGFAAFTSTGMEASSDWRFKTHLANLPIYFEYQDRGISSTDAIEGTYLDAYRNMYDLYVNNDTCDNAEISAKTGDDSRNEFINKEAVFYQNGSWEYTNLINGGFTDDDLAMIPIYIGLGDEANQGLCTGTENFWCVNKEADEASIQATLDFMYWCVTSELGTTTMADDMGFVIPFKAAKESTNLFVRQDNEYTAAGKNPISWNFLSMPSEEWKNGVGTALTIYAADQTDANWDGVVSAFVDGWVTEYQLANQE